MRLVDNYFGGIEEDEAAELTALERRNAKIALFLRTEFFTDEFLPTLEAFKEQHEPGPSQSKEDMLYHIGVRDGVKLVLGYVNELKTALQGERKHG